LERYEEISRAEGKKRKGKLRKKRKSTVSLGRFKSIYLKNRAEKGGKLEGDPWKR